LSKLFFQFEIEKIILVLLNVKDTNFFLLSVGVASACCAWGTWFVCFRS